MTTFRSHALKSPAAQITGTLGTTFSQFSTPSWGLTDFRRVNSRNLKSSIATCPVFTAQCRAGFQCSGCVLVSCASEPGHLYSQRWSRRVTQQRGKFNPTDRVYKVIYVTSAERDEARRELVHLRQLVNDCNDWEAFDLSRKLARSLVHDVRNEAIELGQQFLARKRCEAETAPRSVTCGPGGRVIEITKGSKKCGAKTRSGTRCARLALKNGRCQNHGGLSTGPLSKSGRKRIAEAQKRRWTADRLRRET